MGYSTDFEGEIEINPPLNQKQVNVINAWCDQRHGGNIDPFPSCPGFWCNYEASEDGTKLKWNGSEKSYDMDAWLSYLVKNFFIPYQVTLNGTLVAQGEETGDLWRLVVKDNVVTRLEGHANFDESEEVTFDQLVEFINKNAQMSSSPERFAERLLKKFNVVRKTV